MDIRFSRRTARPDHRWSRWVAVAAVVLLTGTTLATGAAPATAAPSTAADAAAAAAFCETQNLSASMTANVTGPLQSQTWPGGQITVGTGNCTVTVTRPSGSIDLVGSLGDPWQVAVPAGSGFASATITNVGIPNCTSPAAIGSVAANRPSCSSAILSSTGSTASITIRAIADPLLTVDRTLGSGSGKVMSTPSGIECGATCTAQFDLNSVVTLSAVPDPGSHFVQWGGACAGGSTCQVTMSQSQNVTANFAPNPVNTLSVTKGGAGVGTVRSTPGGIDCGPSGPTCAQDFTTGTLVTLTALPGEGSMFAGWGGACSGMGVCSVTLNANTQVIANFATIAVPRSLTISKAGSGSGTVTSNPAGIDCGATCAGQYESGTFVTLTATPAGGSAFAGWSGGGCSGTGPCQVSLTSDTTVTATFVALAVEPVVRSLTVAKSGGGSGTVTSSPAGIDCGATCTGQFPAGATVTLTATPAAGSTFAGWSGGGCSGTGPCQVTLASNTAVSATFVAAEVATPATYQPDGLVAIRTGALLGEGIYNSTGKSQTRSAVTKRRKTATFTWQVQNDGNAADSVRLKHAQTRAKGFKVSYLVGGKNVTRAVAKGTYTASVAAGQSITVTVKVKVAAKAKAKSATRLLLTATSTAQSSKSDTVGVKVTAK